MRALRLLTALTLTACRGSAPATDDAGGGGHDACVGDACGSTTPGCAVRDLDGDGWSDQVELAMETSPADPDDNPAVRDELVFAVPYQEDARPRARDRRAPARVARADVALLLDTTGSMAGHAARFQAAFGELVELLAGEIDDLAFGAAGYGDFPNSNASDNSYADVPFYLVHRIMTARTADGLASLLGSLSARSIFDGLGNWFSLMRGGDEPEQAWEAVRQAVTGEGLVYPRPYQGDTGAVPPFDPATAYPGAPPAGEEVGALGGLGFRADSLPIVILISDTRNHDERRRETTPASADRATALAAVHGLGARVMGVMAWAVQARDDLEWIAAATGARVAPTAWGTGAARPAGCPDGACCLSGELTSTGEPVPQPAPVDGLCTLVFFGDRYDDRLAEVLARAILGLARGGRFEIGADVRDDPGDEVDVVASFVERVEAIAEDGACAGATVVDRDGDGVPDAFPATVAGAEVCFRVTARRNATVPPSPDAPRRFRGELQLTGDGLASFEAHEVWFVVPNDACVDPCDADEDCPDGAYCAGGICETDVE
jgi:hypothetical protein